MPVPGIDLGQLNNLVIKVQENYPRTRFYALGTRRKTDGELDFSGLEGQFPLPWISSNFHLPLKAKLNLLCLLILFAKGL